MAFVSVMPCAWAISAFQEGSCVLFPCSYSALCAPAIPSAARGKQLGDEGPRLAQVTLSNPCFCLTESEGDTSNDLAEGPIHPHRCRWGLLNS